MILIQAFKFSVLVVLILLYIVTTFPLYPYIFIRRYKAKKYLSYITKFYTSLVLKVLNFDITIVNQENFKSETNYLIICNHMSYLDILILLQVAPCNFVTSIEMKKTLLLGQLSELSGALYVERRSRENLKSELQDMTQALKAGLSIGIFPEGTSTNGEQMLPFKRSLFEAAINAGKSVLPMTLNYLTVDSQKVDKGNRDLLCWYGDMDFASHLWRLCGTRKTQVSVSISSPMMANIDDDTKRLRDEAFTEINSSYCPLS